MTLVALLTDLAQLDIQLWLEDGQLRFNAPEGVMTDDIIAKIRHQKPAIIEFLQQSENTASVHIPKVIRDKAGYPVSFAQQRFWFLQQVAPDDTAYHIHSTLMIKGPLDSDRLTDALTQVAAHHPILRTQYQQVEGKLQQRIMDQPMIKVPVFKMPQADAEKAIIDCIQAPFDLASGDVLHTDLFNIGDDRWLLSFTIHHIASDAWSLNTLIAAVVSAYLSDYPAPSPNALDYIDYAVWQQAAHHQEAQLAYWQKQLNNTPVLSLPIDFYRQNPALTDSAHNEAGTCVVSFSQDDAEAIKRLAKEEGISLFVVLITAYAVLLQKYAQQSDFAIGTPIAGRHHSQLDNIMGCFINTLSIRWDVNTDDHFYALLDAAKQTTAAAYMHQDVPFEEVVRALGLHYDATTSPVFQTLFSLQPQSMDEMAVGDLSITALPQSYVAAQFDLKLTVTEDACLSSCFEYKKSLFRPKTIERIANHWLAVVKAVIHAPRQPIKSLPFLGTEASLLLGRGEFNDTATTLPSTTVHQLFEQQVIKTPSSIAASDYQYRLTYAVLNRKANQLAHALLAKDLPKDSVIGMRLSRSVSVLIAQLGILKAGAAYLPVEIDLPIERQQFMLKQAEASYIITDSLYPDITAARVIHLPTFDCEAYPDTNPVLDHVPTGFNVIFTSGSTGEPKGVLMSHSAIANRLLWMQNTFTLVGEDCVLQKTPYGFDVSVWEFFWPLIAGSRCHFLAPDAHKDPRAIASTIEQEAVSCIHFVPSMLSHFLAQPPSHATALTRIFCSGEALSIPLMRQCLEAFPQAQLYNLYGPTEAAIDVSWFQCREDMAYPSVPIGQPIDNIQLHVLDDDLQPLPVGVAGQLYIGGNGLADGYINKHLLTAQAFINNPFQSEGHPSDRLYCTGDMVKMTDDYQLLYLGRRDGQIKLRGQRIELAEIEQQMVSQLPIDQAVVQVKHHPRTQDPYLVAYSTVSEAIIKASKLSDYLPTAMIPQAFVEITEWPLTANGKIDRKQLPEPTWAFSDRAAYMAPRTETEKVLVTLWETALGLEQVGIQDDFFAIGGHSLKAVEILALAQSHFDLDIPLKSIFNNPTIEAIASFIDNHLIAEAVFSDNHSEMDGETDSFVI